MISKEEERKAAAAQILGNLQMPALPKIKTDGFGTMPKTKASSPPTTIAEPKKAASEVSEHLVPPKPQPPSIAIVEQPVETPVPSQHSDEFESASHSIAQGARKKREHIKKSVVYVSLPVYNRLREFRIRHNVSMDSVVLHLIETHLPDPTQVHFLPGYRAAAVSMVKTNPSFSVPAWIEKHPYDPAEAKGGAVSIGITHLVFAKLKEFETAGFSCRRVVSALVTKYLPPAGKSYKKRSHH